MAGSIFATCACRDPQTGKRWPRGQCPKWNQRWHRKWAFTIDLEATAHGKRQQLSRSGFQTRLAAERALEAQLPAIREGTAPTLADRQIKLGEYLDEWLRSDPDWRPSTGAAFRGVVANYLRPELGHIRLAALRPDDVRKMLARLRDRGLSVRTVGQAFAVLRCALNAAVTEQRMSRNPWDPLSKRKKGKKAGRTRSRPVLQVWTPEQVSAFLAHAAKEARLVVAFQLAAWRGLRRGEVCGLKWDDIDLDAGLLRVERNATEADAPCSEDCAPGCPGGKVHIGEPKTEKGTRTVSLGPQLVAALRAHRKAQAAERLAAEDWHDEDWVFPATDGRVLRPFVLTHRFKALAAELPGLPPLHFHGLRHTAATHMLLAGVAPKVVQDQLGHATLAMTMDTYGHILPQQRDDSADAAERLYGESL